METQELLERLDRHRGSYPEDLLAEVIARREEVIPGFLEILEDIDRNPEPWLVDDGRMIHIYALYLLAMFRETHACPSVITSKAANGYHFKTGQRKWPSRTRLFYPVASCGGKSILVRQLRGPHLSTCP
jgi:hypothetical protein